MAAAAVDRVLAALYARARPVKVVAAATGGGGSAAELLFRAGSSSTMLSFAVPYARASLLQFLGDPPDSHAPTKFCSAETAERMARAAWGQALELTRREAEAEGDSDSDLAAAFDRFRSAVGVACTAALATNYSKKGPHEAFVAVCRATPTSTPDADAIAPQCDTYHLTLDKTVGRSREEEDRIVSKWLVYALARASQVDTVACDALYSALTGEHVGDDALRVVRRASEASVDVLESICGETAGPDLTSVCFLPGQQDAAPVVAARGFAFRGVVLPGSFNPLHAGHVELAQAAQRKLLATTGRALPIGFEMAVANADKGAIPAATVLARVRQFAPGQGGAAAAGLGAWPVLVTNATLFGHKAELLRGCAFVVGADTAERLVDPKYYAQDAHRMVLALQRIADRGCSFVVAGRVDAQTRRFVPAEDVLARRVPPAFRHLFLPLAESEYRNDISSTLLRQCAAAAAAATEGQ